MASILLHTYRKIFTTPVADWPFWHGADWLAGCFPPPEQPGNLRLIARQRQIIVSGRRVPYRDSRVDYQDLMVKRNAPSLDRCIAQIGNEVKFWAVQPYLDQAVREAL